MRQAKPDNCGSENAQRTGDKERILTSSDGIWITLQNGKDIGAHKSTNLPNGCCDGVILASNGSGASLGRQKADVVAGAEFPQRQEDTGQGQSLRESASEIFSFLLYYFQIPDLPVDNDEGGNVLG